MADLSLHFADETEGEGYDSNDSFEGDGSFVELLKSRLDDTLVIWQHLGRMRRLEKLTLKNIGQIGQNFAKCLPRSNDEHANYFTHLRIIKGQLQESAIESFPLSLTHLEMDDSKLIRRPTTSSDDYSAFFAEQYGFGDDSVGQSRSGEDVRWPKHWKKIPLEGGLQSLPNELQCFSSTFESFNMDIMSNFPTSIRWFQLIDDKTNPYAFTSSVYPHWGSPPNSANTSAAIPDPLGLYNLTEFSLTAFSIPAQLTTLIIECVLSFDNLPLLKDFSNLVMLNLALEDLEWDPSNRTNQRSLNHLLEVKLDKITPFIEKFECSSTLERLHLTNFPISHPAFSPDRFFSKLPRLTHLDLHHALGITNPLEMKKEGLETDSSPSPLFAALPRGLRHLSISNIEVNTSCMSKLPPELVYLKLSEFSVKVTRLTLQTLPRKLIHLSLGLMCEKKYYAKLRGGESSERTGLGSEANLLEFEKKDAYSLPNTLCSFEIIRSHYRNSSPFPCLFEEGVNDDRQLKMSHSNSNPIHSNSSSSNSRNSSSNPPNLLLPPSHTPNIMPTPSRNAFLLQDLYASLPWSQAWVTSQTTYLEPSCLPKQLAKRK
jgi:hypothetical protein